MREIMWNVRIADNKVAIAEQGKGFPTDNIESHLLIIGILENIKQKHQERFNTLFNQTKKLSGGKDGN